MVEDIEWADIPGFRGYQASPDAQILDVAKNRLKKQRKAPNGAMRVKLGKSSPMVHDLVARAFHGRPTCKGFRVKFIAGKSAHEKNLVWSGKSDRTQSPRFDHSIDAEYCRIKREREFLADLMQS